MFVRRTMIGRTIVGRLRNTGLLAGMLALLVQMVAWGTGLPANAAAFRGDGANSIVICTFEGLKRILVDPDGQVLPDGGNGGDRADPAGGHCPLCPVVGGAGLPPEPIMVSLPEQTGDPVVRRPADDAHAKGRAFSGWQARAPPWVA